jgi:sugar phosphate isomerase/epimerase
MKTAIFTKVFGDRTLEKAFELTADLGFDAVELMCREPHFDVRVSDERARYLRDRLDELGLDVAGMGTYTGGYVGKSDDECRQELEDLERFLELSDVMETDLIRHHVGGPPSTDAEEEDYHEAADWLRRAADLAADRGKRLGIEIHHGRISDTAESTVKLLELIDRDNVGAIHDAGNMYIVGTDYGPASIEELGDWLTHVHVKDVLRVEGSAGRGTFTLETRRGKETFQHRLLGHGAVDHEPVFRAIEDAGYDGYLSVECHRETDDVWRDVTVADHERETIEGLRGT